MKKLVKQVSTVAIASTVLVITILGVWAVSTLINVTGDSKEQTANAAQDPAVFKENISYCNTSNPNQTLDAYLISNASEPSPAIIYVHGGGWNQGDKQNPITKEYSTLFTENDIAFITVDYRLSTEAVYPAQNDDVRCAIDYIVKNTAEWNIDAKRLIIMGDSAGGQLASTELLSRKHLYDSAIIAYGVSNLWRQITSYHDKNAVGYLGSTDKALANKASPQFENLNDAPPFLLVHGTADTVVPADESKNFAKKLMDAGVTTTYSPIQNAPHAFLGTNDSFDKKAKAIIIGFVKTRW